MDNEDFGGFKGECPLLGIGRVDSYDSESHSVYVRFTSWQMPFPARMLINGDCDGVRINQQPLPIRGTWGLIAFPRGDYRNAVWLGSFVNGTSYSSGAQSTDAINSSNTDIDSQMRYYSHFSGYYDLLDGIGNFFARYPDGTNILVNSNNQEPTTYRHVVNSAGARQRVVFEDSYRTPTPPNPFYATLNHSSGTYLTISPSGSVTVNGATNVPVGNNTKLEVSMQKEINFVQADPNNETDTQVKLNDSGIQIVTSGSDLPISISTLQAGSGINIQANSQSSNIVIQTPNASISINGDGSIGITGVGGVTINGGGSIRINSAVNIAMTAPPSTITANGNVLG